MPRFIVLLNVDSVLVGNALNLGTNSIGKMISTHGWANHDFIKVVIVDPDRSVFGPEVSGTAGETLGNPMHTRCLFSSFDDMYKFARWEHFDLSEFTASQLQVRLDLSEMVQLLLIVRIMRDFSWVIQHVIQAALDSFSIVL